MVTQAAFQTKVEEAWKRYDKQGKGVLSTRDTGKVMPFLSGMGTEP